MEFWASELRCPVCGTAAMVEVPSGVAPTGHEADLRPIYGGPDPIAAELHACSGCRYAGYPDAFVRPTRDEEEPLDRHGEPAPRAPLGAPDEADLDDLRRWIRSGALVRETGLGTGEPSAAQRYLLAARVREFLGHTAKLPHFDLLLRGAWCARAGGDAALERRLRSEAAESLEAALEEGVQAGERAKLVYLAGELARRVGRFPRSVARFSELERAADPDDDEAQYFAKLARRQLALATIQSSVAARLPTPEELLEAEGARSPPPRPGGARGDEDEEGDGS